MKCTGRAVKRARASEIIPWRMQLAQSRHQISNMCLERCQHVGGQRKGNRVSSACLSIFGVTPQPEDSKSLFEQLEEKRMANPYGISLLALQLASRGDNETNLANTNSGCFDNLVISYPLLAGQSCKSEIIYRASSSYLQLQ